MDSTFIKDLITRAQLAPLVIMENGGEEIKIIFKKEPGITESQDQKLFMVELFQEIFSRKLKVKTFSFSFKNKEGKDFTFNLDNSDTSSACAAKNGIISLYLSKDDVKKFQALSGQQNNKAYKVATFAFDPANLKPLNCTMFYLSDLTTCVIENS